MLSKLALPFALIAAFALPASAQDDAAAGEEKAWGLEIGYDYSTKYFFRGLDLLGGEPVHTPRVVFTAGGFSAYYYGYLGDLGPDGPDYHENDFGLDYTLSSGKLSLTLGVIAYTYQKPADFEDTTEAYAIASWDVLMAPTLSFYYDFDLYDGGYASLGVSHSIPLSEKASIELSGLVGFDLGYYSEIFATSKSSGLNDVLLGLNVPVQLTDHFSIRGMIQQSIALDVLDEPEIAQDDETILTFGAAVAF